MTEKLNIEYIEIDKIKPYDNNPRVNDDAVDSVALSIKNYGFRQPIVVDKDMVIVVGHTRRLAAMKLGMKTVPCIIASDLSAEQAMAYRLDDNKTAEFAMWDFSKLAEELQGLQDVGYDMDSLAFDTEEIDRILSEDSEKEINTGEGETDADEVPEVDEKDFLNIASEQGKVYCLGEHRLLCGKLEKNTDALFIGDGECPAEMAIMAFGITPEMMSDFTRDEEDGLEIKFDDIAYSCSSAMKSGGAYYIIYDDENIGNIEMCEGCGLDYGKSLIWNCMESHEESEDYAKRHYPIRYGHKQGSASRWHGDKSASSILSFKSVDSGYVPVDLIKQLISNSSLKNDIVFAPIGHSGTILMACEQTGRKCRMIEFRNEYCDIIRRRWAEYKYGVGCDWESLTPEFTGTEAND